MVKNRLAELHKNSGITPGQENGSRQEAKVDSTMWTVKLFDKFSIGRLIYCPKLLNFYSAVAAISNENITEITLAFNSGLNSHNANNELLRYLNMISLAFRCRKEDVTII
jgi:hypothetical protein